MKLLIISHTAHYLDNGIVKGWGPTVREINYLASLFSEVVHIATIHDGPAPQSAMPYTAHNIRLHGVEHAGGSRLRDKLDILLQLPAYLAACSKEMAEADIIHIRAPANISLIAILVLAARRTPQKRWIKYAGNWKPEKPDAWSYRFQRWWLRKGWHQAEVTVNGQWSEDPPFVHTFFNPCLTDQQVQQGTVIARKKKLTTPLRMVFVGRIDVAKGVGRILNIASQLQAAEVKFTIDMIGGGPEQERFEELARNNGITDFIHFHGWLPRDQVDAFYGKAHFILFPSSSSEGWPKVLSEAMAYGAVPITSDVSSIPQYLTQFNTGRFLPPDDISSFVNTLIEYHQDPERWKRESTNAVASSHCFTYSYYLERVRALLELP